VAQAHPQPALRVLVVEDLESDFMLVNRHLSVHGIDATCVRAGSRAALVEALRAPGWDIALSDYNVPGLPFRDGLALIREVYPHLPVILVSGSVGEEEAVELLKLGLSDFVLKDRLTRLVPVVERSLREAADGHSRRATERALRDSEERHRLALDAAALGTWRHDVEGDHLAFDERAREHFELDGPVATLKASLEGVHPDDRDRLGRFLTTASDGSLSGERPVTEARIRRRDGSTRWLAVAVRPPRDGPGTGRRATVVIGTSQDVTDRHEAEAALRERIDLQDQLARIGTAVPGVVYSFRLRPDGTMSVPFATRAMYDVFRIRCADIAHDAGPLFARVHPADLAWLQDSIRASAASMTPWRAEFRLVHEDGVEHWIEGHSMPQREEDGSIIWHGFAQDVTDRMRADERLRASEARWQFALEGADQAVWDWHVPTGEVFFSRRWKSMMELTDHQVENRLETWSVLVHPDDLPQAFAALERHFRGDAPTYESEHRMRCAGGTERWVLDRGKVVEWSPQGEPRRVIGTMTDITPRKKMEEALRESEARANLILDTVPEAILVTDADGVVIRANRRACELFRHARGEFEGVRADDLVPPRFRRGHDVMRARYLTEGTQRLMGMGRELSALRADGTEFPAEISLGLVVFGSVSHVIVTVSDITTRKHAEQALRQSEQTLAQAQAMAHLGSWQVDFAAEVLIASAEMKRILQVQSDRLPKSAVFDMVHPDDLAAVLEAWTGAVKGRAPYDIEHRAIIGGSVRWLHAKAILVHGADGRAVSAVGMTQDITEVREAQRALEAHRQHLENVVAARTAQLRQQASYLYALVDNVPFEVWLKDTGNRYLAVNRANAAARGLSVTEMVGRTDVELLPQDLARVIADEDAEVRSARQPRTGEVRVDRNGQAQWVETYNAPVLDQDGTVLGTVGFARDITDRKAGEAARDAALAEARRLAQLRSDFLANMSHEIRTPLNAVLGLAQGGARSDADSEVRRLFHRILDSGALLLGIVDDILDFSKIEAGKSALESVEFDPGDVVDRAIALVATKAYAKGLVMRVQEAQGMPVTLHGDPQRLVQVLVNLLANAIKFTEQGEVVLSVSHQAGRLGFTVEDTGIGIAPAHLGRLFQAFEQADGSTTRRFGGTGLGLAISRRLVEMMGGQIHVVSEEGRGTSFRVSIPFAAAVTTPEPPRLPSWVALVGLEPHEAEAMSGDLADRGICVTVVDAVDMAGVAADLAVLDREVYEALAARLPPCRIVVACVPGSSVAPKPEHGGRVSIVERPLRVRHLLSAADDTRVFRGVTSDGAPRLQGMRVLAAEDNEVNRLVLETLLGQEGAHLVQTVNGRLAVDRLEADGPQAFDVVLTDIQMPLMDGYETARRIKAMAPDLPVIGLTAHAMPGERDRCLQAGMVEHVAKPVDLDRLVAVLLRHVPQFADRAAGRERVADPVQAPLNAIESPLVDWSGLLKRFKARREFVDKLVVTVIRTHENTAERLRAAASGGHVDEIVFVAHSLKGMGGNLMARPLQEHADQTEASARSGAPEAVGLAMRLADVLEETLAALSEGVP